MGIVSRILVGAPETPEKRRRRLQQEARNDARWEYEQSTKYQNIQRKNRALISFDKITKILFKIRNSKNKNMDASALWNKWEWKAKEGKFRFESSDVYYSLLAHEYTLQKWGGTTVDDSFQNWWIEKNRKGDNRYKLRGFLSWFVEETLNQGDVYDLFMSKDSSFMNKENRKNKNKLIFDHLYKEIYLPLLYEKWKEFGVYDKIFEDEEVIEKEPIQAIGQNQELNRIDISQQLELLKHQQAILDKQIELEKIKNERLEKENNNNLVNSLSGEGRKYN